MLRHAPAGGEYNRRRAECEAGARFFAERIPGVSALRDVHLSNLQRYGSELPEIVGKRCRHVITANLRVHQAAAFGKGDLEGVGKLMADSPVSLRDQFEVSCRELSVMMDVAREIEGGYGARMTGSEDARSI